MRMRDAIELENLRKRVAELEDICKYVYKIQFNDIIGKLEKEFNCKHIIESVGLFGCYKQLFLKFDNKHKMFLCNNYGEKEMCRYLSENLEKIKKDIKVFIHDNICKKEKRNDQKNRKRK